MVTLTVSFSFLQIVPAGGLAGFAHAVMTLLSESVPVPVPVLSKLVFPLSVVGPLTVCWHVNSQVSFGSRLPLLFVSPMLWTLSAPSVALTVPQFGSDTDTLVNGASPSFFSAYV